MSDFFVWICIIILIVSLSTIGVKGCDDLEVRLKDGGLKGIVSEIWEGTAEK